MLQLPLIGVWPYQQAHSAQVCLGAMTMHS